MGAFVNHLVSLNLFFVWDNGCDVWGAYFRLIVALSMKHGCSLSEELDGASTAESSGRQIDAKKARRQ